MRTSRFIAWALRHGAPGLGLELDSQGWADITELCRCATDRGVSLTEEHVCEIVESDQKQRFVISSDGARIRAWSGHSLDVDSAFVPKSPPPVLFHGTAAGSLESVMSDGLVPRYLGFVRLSPDPVTPARIGRHHGRLVTLEVDAQVMCQEGRTFYWVGAETWVVLEVPPRFLRVIDHGSGGESTAV